MSIQYTLVTLRFIQSSSCGEYIDFDFGYLEEN